MAGHMDLFIDRFQHSWSEVGNATAAQLTVTKAAAALRAHAVVKVDASYSVSTVSGLLTVSFGATEIGKKYIHGSGALDFAADPGILNPDANETVVAVLDSGGGGIVGTITMSGFTTAPAS